jgi:hypothetical protein
MVQYRVEWQNWALQQSFLAFRRTNNKVRQFINNDCKGRLGLCLRPLAQMRICENLDA